MSNCGRGKGWHGRGCASNVCLMTLQECVCSSRENPLYIQKELTMIRREREIGEDKQK